MEIELGELWKLERHHLWVGDALSIDAPATNSDLVLTDPPFQMNALSVRNAIEKQSDKFIVAGCGYEYHKLIAGCGLKFHFEIICRRSKSQSLPEMIGPQILHWNNAFLTKNGRHCFDRDLKNDYFPSILDMGTTDVKASHAKPLKWAVELLGVCQADKICDPFVGSGTTLIACEMLGKKCFAFENNLEKCKLTIARWTHKTNLTPELIN